MEDDASEAPEGEKEVADRPAKNMTYAVKAADAGQDKGIKRYADAPAGRVSLKEKLEAMKVQAGGKEKSDIGKSKGKEVAI